MEKAEESCKGNKTATVKRTPGLFWLFKSLRFKIMASQSHFLLLRLQGGGGSCVEPGRIFTGQEKRRKE